MRRAYAPAHAAPQRLRADQVGVAALALAGAVLAVLDDASPVGHDGYDGVWRFVGGGLIVVCGAAAPPVAWVLAAAIAAASSAQPLLIGIGAVALAGATFGAMRYEQVRSIGAGVGVLVGVIGFRLPHESPIGLATLVAIVAAAPLVVMAWYAGPVALGKFLNGLASVVVVLGVASGVALAFAAFDARSELESAQGHLDDAVDGFRDGDEDIARGALDAAVAALERADSAMHKPWLAPARAIPIVGQHTRALQVVAANGADTTTAAQTVLDDLDRDSLAITGGAVDLDAVRRLEPSVTALAAAAAVALDELDDIRSPWLIDAVDDGVSEAVEELVDATDSTRRASDAIRLAPAMLGGDGVRHHLVLFVTPAELRGSGGLVGNWALIEADQGRLELVEVGRAEDLNRTLESRPVALTEPDAYVEAYGRFAVETAFQDVSLSPHFPDVAVVAAQLFEEAQGVAVDTVMQVDPDGVAALLALTGPVTVDGVTLDSDTARDFLLIEQYSAFDSEAERVQFLDAMLGTTFLRLLAIDLPDPWDLDETFADVVDQDRLLIASVDADEQVLLEDLDVGGAFPAVDGDLLGVITQNRGQNKIDSFLTRSVVYDAALDPALGTISATVTIELTNLVTNLEMANAVVGNNDQGYPLGTNVLDLTIYTPHRLVGATMDGAETALTAASQFGVRAYSQVIELPPDSTTTVTLRLEGTMPLGAGYRLDLPVQPAVLPDSFDLAVTVPEPWTIGGLSRWNAPVRTSADQSFELDVEWTG